MVLDHEHEHQISQINRTIRRLSVGDLQRVLNFAEAIVIQKSGKREKRNASIQKQNERLKDLREGYKNGD